MNTAAGKEGLRRKPTINHTVDDGGSIGKINGQGGGKKNDTERPKRAGRCCRFTCVCVCVESEGGEGRYVFHAAAAFCALVGTKSRWKKRTK
jgi:hypothetical protein